MNDQFSYGVISMARNCLPACQLLKQGKWTIEDMEKWLQAIIDSDSQYFSEVIEHFNPKLKINNL
jgi:hypothetical protein